MPYPVRVLIWVGFSVCGMLLVALSPSYTDSSVISQKLSGIVLASFSSGVRELSFLSLTHLYGSFSLAAWGSGIGGAGLIGAGVYVPATTSFGFSVRTTLLASACLPAIMVVNFFIILPRGPLNSATWSRESVASEAQTTRMRDSLRQKTPPKQRRMLRILSHVQCYLPVRRVHFPVLNTVLPHS
jgi:hypothetical protein